MKILFTSAWYPNRYDSMFGLFVQKHAEAVNLFAEVKVLYVHPAEDTDQFEIIEQYHNKLHEIIVYYPIKPRNFLHKLIKITNYLKAYKKGFEHIHNAGFFPDVIHANILTRTGFIASRYAKKRKIPYIITEHWSRYLPAQNGYKGTLRKWLTQKVVREASAILPISGVLKEAMITHGLKNPNYRIINNVVEDIFFEKKAIILHQKKRILHISCFDEKAKNVRGIINAAYKLSKKRNDFELVLIGNGADFKQIYEYALSLDPKSAVFSFIGEKTPNEVACYLQNSDVFVLFSNYETAGVVIAESLASGTPVISTKVGIAPECINARNGILVNPGDEAALLDSMDYMLDHYLEFDPEQVRKDTREMFSYEEIGKQIFNMYNTVLSKKHKGTCTVS